MPADGPKTRCPASTAWTTAALGSLSCPEGCTPSELENPLKGVQAVANTFQPSPKENSNGLSFLGTTFIEPRGNFSDARRSIAMQPGVWIRRIEGHGVGDSNDLNIISTPLWEVKRGKGKPTRLIQFLEVISRRPRVQSHRLTKVACIHWRNCHDLRWRQVLHKQLHLQDGQRNLRKCNLNSSQCPRETKVDRLRIRHLQP